MKVIIGGANNGKRKYVLNQLKQKNIHRYIIFEGSLPPNDTINENYVIIGNFEKIIKPYLHLDEDQIVKKIVNKLKKLDHQANVICICTDIGRGIVPIEKEERKIRDTIGRLYQKLFSESESVIRIWYGIPQSLKGEQW